MVFVEGSDFIERLMSVRAACPNCGSPVQFKEGVELAWQTTGSHDQVVMCKKCGSIYEVNVGPGRMQLTADVTGRYSAAR